MSSKKISRKVMQSILSMHEDDFTGVSVGKLADQLEINRYKLLRYFKQETGMTLESYIFKEKMGRAAFLLASNRDITIKEVAKKVGFSSSDYFIRKFKLFFGIVPGKYRDYKFKK